MSSGEVFMKEVAWCSWWVQWWYRRADEGKFPVFMMWSRARSGHRNLYTHLQDTYITSSVVSEGRWKVTVSVLQGEALSWVARIKGAFVTQFIMCYTWKTLAPNPDGGGGATGLLQSWRWCHLHWDLKDEQKLALKALTYISASLRLSANTFLRLTSAYPMNEILFLLNCLTLLLVARPLIFFFPSAIL